MIKRPVHLHRLPGCRRVSRCQGLRMRLAPCNNGKKQGNSVGRRLRQECSDGSIFFSNMCAREEVPNEFAKCLLLNNYRSCSEIVSKLNAYSCRNFPNLGREFPLNACNKNIYDGKAVTLHSLSTQINSRGGGGGERRREALH